jgi:hypothetical protein
MFLRLFASALIAVSFSSLSLAQACKLPVGIVGPNGESFRGLSTDQFAAHAGKVTVPIKSLTYDDGARRIVVVVDTSKKLSMDARKASASMVETLVASARPNDSFAFIAARGPERVVKFGEDRADFVRSLSDENEVKGGKGGVLDAVMQGISLFGDSQPGDSIVVIAQDLEGSKTTNPRKVAKALQDHKVRMFGLALGLVATRNATVSGQSTTAWGLAQARPATGDMIYNTGDEDFYPLTKNSGGLVIAVMGGDYQHTYSMKDPKFQASVKQKAQVLFNMIAGLYEVELTAPPAGEWNIEPSENLRKAAPAMFLLFPHEIASCQNAAHVAKN